MKPKPKPETEMALLRLVADIRTAVGDPKGKLMQDELVEHCRKLKADSDRHLATGSTAPEISAANQHNPRHER